MREHPEIEEMEREGRWEDAASAWDLAQAVESVPEDRGRMMLRREAARRMHRLRFPICTVCGGAAAPCEGRCVLTGSPVHVPDLEVGAVVRRACGAEVRYLGARRWRVDGVDYPTPTAAALAVERRRGKRSEEKLRGLNGWVYWKIKKVPRPAPAGP